VLYSTTEPKVVRNYVIALWLADISHVAITCVGMEYDRLVDFANWNPMTCKILSHCSWTIYN
jgi:hypothetical protein